MPTADRFIRKLCVRLKLLQLAYSEFERASREWVLRPVEFGPVNLIVGKNSAGKTRLVNVLSGFASFLRGRPLSDGNFRAVFASEDGQAIYEAKIRNRVVRHERYTVGKTTLLSRKADGKGSISSIELDGQKLRFDVPDNQLAAVLKRDSIQHPFLEELYTWATSVKTYKFGADMGATQLVLELPTTDIGSDSKKRSGSDNLDTSKLFLVYRSGLRRFGKTFNRALIDTLYKLDYNVTKIGFDYLKRTEFQGPSLPPAYLYVKERELKCITRQMEMSSGMFRALNLAIQLNYWSMSKAKICMLIDDIGEGLDFDRASKLIKLIVSYAEKNDFQLIMTSNDRFVMNAVPLKYWGVLDRRGHSVRVITPRNSPKQFESFEKIGLSNFDFFARDLYKARTKRPERQ